MTEQRLREIESCWKDYVPEDNEGFQDAFYSACTHVPDFVAEVRRLRAAIQEAIDIVNGEGGDDDYLVDILEVALGDSR